MYYIVYFIYYKNLLIYIGAGNNYRLHHKKAKRKNIYGDIFTLADKHIRAVIIHNHFPELRDAIKVERLLQVTYFGEDDYFKRGKKKREFHKKQFLLF